MGNDDAKIKEGIKDKTHLVIITWGQISNTNFLEDIKGCKAEIVCVKNIYEKITKSSYPYYIFYILYKKDYSLLKDIIKSENNLVILNFCPEESERKNLIEKLSKIDYKGKHCPFIIFFSSLTREYYRDYIYENNINFDPLNIYTEGSKYNFKKLY